MLTATRGPYVLVIQPDDDPFNPREDDNFGKMVCFHRRYPLGDHHNYIDKDDFLRDLYLKTVGDNERGAHRYERALDLMNYKIKAPFDSPAYEREVDERLMKVISQKFLMLPLYLYDHSGITMNTTGFSCPWDSGQVGWIYASKEDALREFGGKSFTAATRKKAEDCMRGEVECYDSYLRGEAYGFELYSQWDNGAYTHYLNTFSLKPDQTISSLSRGMKMKFSLALALSHHAELLIMDEPTSGLDPLVRKQFIEILKEYMAQGGKAVFYSTHNTSDLDKAADILVMIDNGKILFEEDKDMLLESHRLVKGKGILPAETKKLFLKVEQAKYGFTGVTNQVEQTRSMFPDAVFERVTVEDIMLAHIKEGEPI